MTDAAPSASPVPSSAPGTVAASSAVTGAETQTDIPLDAGTDRPTPSTDSQPTPSTGGAGDDGTGPSDGTNREVAGFARGGALSVLSAGVNQVAQFALVLLLARQLGAAALGRYTTAYALLSLLSLLAMSGVRSALTRFVAVHRSDGDQAALHGVVRLGLATTLVSSTVCGVALFACSDWLAAQVFGKPDLSVLFHFVAVILIFQSMTDAALSATTGFKSMRAYSLIGLIYEPVTRIVLTLVLVAMGLGITGAMTALVVSNATACLLALLSLRRLMGRWRYPVVYRPSELFSFSMVTWVGSLATTGLIWADTLILSMLAPDAEVGVYNAATRLVTLATFVMPPLNATLAPRIADLFRRGDLQALSRLYSVGTNWILRLSLPAFVALILLPNQMLALFGNEFVVKGAAACTILLAVGKLMDAGTGPCAMILNMSGMPGLSTIDNVIVLAMNVGMNLYLVPRHGMVGAAVAWAVSLWVVNMVRVFQVWLVLRMVPFDLGIAKTLAAGVAAFVAGFVSIQLVPTRLELPVGLVTVTVVYFLTVFAAGLTEEDRVVFRSLAGRFTRSSPRTVDHPV